MDYSTVKPLFEKADVRKALLIDDAFDPMPPFDDADLQNAFGLLEGSDALEDAFKEIGGAWPSAYAAFAKQMRDDHQIQAQLLSALTLPDDASLHVIAKAMYGANQQAHLNKKAPLDALCAVLRDVGIETKEIGSEEEPEGGDKFPLIFLDYFLGEDGTPSVDRSISKIETILKSYGNDELPLVVLMSSAIKDTADVEKFRERADLLGCQFVFIPKDMFTAAAFELISKLAARAEVLAQSRVLSEFIKTWKASLGDAMEKFSHDIKTVDLSDLYFIWKKAGDGKNKRFGDHVSTLFDGFLRKLIEDAKPLKGVSEKLNALSFKAMPPSPMIPSPVVAKLAHASAFRDLEPFPEGYRSPPLGIDLGELFIRDRRVGKPKVRELKAMMVISQACDLEHGKVGTVLLVEGVVTPRTAETRPSSGGTHSRLQVDIFQYTNDDGAVDDLIIAWDAQRLRAVAVDTFHADMEKEGYERVARLRPLHALAMQQKFASQLTRVGMPDSLPVYRYGSLEVLIASSEAGKLKPLMSPIGRAEKPICIVGDDEKHMIIMDDALDKVRKALKAANPAHFAEGAIDKLRSELDDVAKLLKIQNCSLDKSAKQLNIVLLKDSEERLAEDFKLPKKALAVLNFFPK